MNILDLLFAHSIPSYNLNIETTMQASVQFPLGGNLPTNIGCIYGASVYTDGVNFSNNDLITTNDAFNMYVNFRMSTDDMIEQLRLSDLVNFVAGSPVTTRPYPFTQVLIPNRIDLTKSYYLNPTLIGPGGNNKTVVLKLWYISVGSWKYLNELGLIKDEGKMINTNPGK